MFENNLYPISLPDPKLKKSTYEFVLNPPVKWYSALYRAAYDLYQNEYPIDEAIHFLNNGSTLDQVDLKTVEIVYSGGHI